MSRSSVNSASVMARSTSWSLPEEKTPSGSSRRSFETARHALDVHPGLRRQRLDDLEELRVRHARDEERAPQGARCALMNGLCSLSFSCRPQARCKASRSSHTWSRRPPSRRVDDSDIILDAESDFLGVRQTNVTNSRRRPRRPSAWTRAAPTGFERAGAPTYGDTPGPFISGEQCRANDVPFEITPLRRLEEEEADFP